MDLKLLPSSVFVEFQKGKFCSNLISLKIHTYTRDDLNEWYMHNILETPVCK